MLRLLLIASAGAAGTLARHGMNLALLQPATRTGYPFATLAVNLIGCFLAGLCGGYFIQRPNLPDTYRLAITVGFLGGFTTFSAFGLETATLLREHHYFRASLHILLNNILGITLAFAGLLVARKLT